MLVLACFASRLAVALCFPLERAPRTMHFLSQYPFLTLVDRRNPLFIFAHRLSCGLNRIVPYQIALHDGRLIFAPQDTDHVIRLRPPPAPDAPSSPEYIPQQGDDEEYEDYEDEEDEEADYGDEDNDDGKM